jgi:hypothetical protein
MRHIDELPRPFRRRAAPHPARCNAQGRFGVCGRLAGPDGRCERHRLDRQRLPAVAALATGRAVADVAADTGLSTREVVELAAGVQRAIALR